MNFLKGSLLLSGLSVICSIPIALFLLKALSYIPQLIFMGAFLYVLIGWMAYNREAKEYYLNNHKSMYKEKNDLKVLRHLEVVYRFLVAGVLNLVIYFVLINISTFQ